MDVRRRLWMDFQIIAAWVAIGMVLLSEEGRGMLGERVSSIFRLSCCTRRHGSSSPRRSVARPMGAAGSRACEAWVVCNRVIR